MDNIRRRSSIQLVWCIFLLYTVSTFTKLNYSASMAYIVKEGIFSKTHSGIIVSAFYLIYGMGQMLGAKAIDKYSPYSLELLGLSGSLLCNLALCFSSNYIWVLIFWSINGLALCVTWPGAARMVSEYVLDEHRRLGTSLLSISIAVGGILSYSCVSVILESFGWSGVFIMNSAVTLLMIILWLYMRAKTERLLFTEREPSVKTELPHPSEGLIPLVLRSGMVFILVIYFVGSVLNNGLKAWVSTMMMESYNISTVWASLQTAGVYICNVVGVFFITPIVLRLKTEVKMMAALCIAVIPFMIVLLSIGKIPQLAATLSLMIVTSLLYQLNNMQVIISSKFAAKGVGHSGAVTSLLNSFASFGVLIAGALFGFIAENFSWQAVIIFCFILTIIAVFLTVPAYFMWKKFLRE